jgi:hypothetical protein
MFHVAFHPDEFSALAQTLNQVFDRLEPAFLRVIIS